MLSQQVAKGERLIRILSPVDPNIPGYYYALCPVDINIPGYGSD